MYRSIQFDVPFFASKVPFFSFSGKTDKRCPGVRVGLGKDPRGSFVDSPDQCARLVRADPRCFQTGVFEFNPTQKVCKCPVTDSCVDGFVSEPGFNVYGYG